jgi:hypothetical protein
LRVSIRKRWQVERLALLASIIADKVPVSNTRLIAIHGGEMPIARPTHDEGGGNVRCYEVSPHFDVVIPVTMCQLRRSAAPVDPMRLFNQADLLLFKTNAFSLCS